MNLNMNLNLTTEGIRRRLMAMPGQADFLDKINKNRKG